MVAAASASFAGVTRPPTPGPPYASTLLSISCAVAGAVAGSSPAEPAPPRWTQRPLRRHRKRTAQALAVALAEADSPSPSPPR